MFMQWSSVTSLYALSKTVIGLFPQRGLLAGSIRNRHNSMGVMSLQQPSKRLISYKNEPFELLTIEYNSDTDPLFKSSKILKLDYLYESQIVLFMQHFLHHKLPVF